MKRCRGRTCDGPCKIHEQIVPAGLAAEEGLRRKTRRGGGGHVRRALSNSDTAHAFSPIAPLFHPPPTPTPPACAPWTCRRRLPPLARPGP